MTDHRDYFDEGDNVGRRPRGFDPRRYDHTTSTTAFMTCMSYHRHDIVRVEFGWDESDPCAVDINITSPGQPGVTWTMGRELMHLGFSTDVKVGHSDIQIWGNPKSTGGRAGDGLLQFVVMKFESPNGVMMFSVSRNVVMRFIRRTFTLCSVESESRIVEQGVDRLIARLRPR